MDTVVIKMKNEILIQKKSIQFQKESEHFNWLHSFSTVFNDPLQNVSKNSFMLFMTVYLLS